MKDQLVGDAKTVTNKTFFLDLVQINEELSQTVAVISRSTFQLQQMVILRYESGCIYSRQARYELVLQLSKTYIIKLLDTYSWNLLS